jgi:hypothetical protein
MDTGIQLHNLPGKRTPMPKDRNEQGMHNHDAPHLTCPIASKKYAWPLRY